MVKNPLPVQEMWARSMSWEDPLLKEMANSSILAWEIPRTEEAGRLQVSRVTRESDTT